VLRDWGQAGGLGGGRTFREEGEISLHEDFCNVAG